MFNRNCFSVVKQQKWVTSDETKSVLERRHLNNQDNIFSGRLTREVTKVKSINV